MKHLYKNLIVFITIIGLQASIFGMEGTIPGSKYKSKLPITKEALQMFNYIPTDTETKFFHAVERNDMNAVKQYAKSLNLKSGLTNIALYIAAQSNNQPMAQLLRYLHKSHGIARRIE